MSSPDRHWAGGPSMPSTPVTGNSFTQLEPRQQMSPTGSYRSRGLAIGGGRVASILTTSVVGEETFDLLAPSSSLAVNGGEGHNIQQTASTGSLKLLQFVPMIYFLACGGPFGSEVAVQAGYPAFYLIFSLLVPLFWNFPIGLMTAELGTAMPDNEGFIRWIHNAFGPAASFVASLTSWLNYVVDNALYPVLFTSYVVHMVQGYSWYAGWVAIFIRVSMIFVVMILNFVGVDVVGSLSTVFTVVMLAPFGVMLVWALVLGEIQPRDWIMFPPGFKLSDPAQIAAVSLCLNIVVWNNSGYEATGNIVEELRNPRKNLSRALTLAILLSVVTYVLCIVAALGVDSNYENWVAGYFTALATKLGGFWFGLAMTIGAVISTFATFNALLCSSSQVFSALGNEDLLNIPILKWRHPKFGTPWVAIFLESLFVVGTSFFSFDELVVVNNVLYCSLLLGIMFAFIRLRFSMPHLERPYRLGGKANWGGISFVIPSIVIALWILGTGAYGSPAKCGAALGFMVASALFYFFRRWYRERVGFVSSADVTEPLLGVGTQPL